MCPKKNLFNTYKSINGGSVLIRKCNLQDYWYDQNNNKWYIYIYIYPHWPLYDSTTKSNVRKVDKTKSFFNTHSILIINYLKAIFECIISIAILYVCLPSPNTLARVNQSWIVGFNYCMHRVKNCSYYLLALLYLELEGPLMPRIIITNG